MRSGSILDAALARGLVEKRGSWLAFGDRQLGQGQLAAIAFLKEHPEVADELVAVVREKASAAGGKEASWRASA